MLSLERCRIGCFGKWIWVIKERKMRCCKRESMVGKLYRSSAAYSSNFFFHISLSIDRSSNRFICFHLSVRLSLCLSVCSYRDYIYLFVLFIAYLRLYFLFSLIAFSLFIRIFYKFLFGWMRLIIISLRLGFFFFLVFFLIRNIYLMFRQNLNIKKTH